jgi:hypothetical protein
LIEYDADFFAKVPTSTGLKWKVGSAYPGSSPAPDDEPGNFTLITEIQKFSAPGEETLFTIVALDDTNTQVAENVQLELMGDAIFLGRKPGKLNMPTMAAGKQFVPVLISSDAALGSIVRVTATVGNTVMFAETTIAPENLNEEKDPDCQAGTLQFQKAGSQVVIDSSGMAEGQYVLLEDGKEASRFSLSDKISSVVIEKRITGAISIRRADAAVQSALTIEATRGLLWFQNFNLGIIDPSRIQGAQALTLTQLSRGMKPRSANTWDSRESDTTKFICTGIYGPGSSLSDKIMARKRAKAACEYAQIQDPWSKVSFWFQTKETQAPSYVNRVLVTVKGLEKSVEEGLG